MNDWNRFTLSENKKKIQKIIYQKAQYNNVNKVSLEIKLLKINSIFYTKTEIKIKHW